MKRILGFAAAMVFIAVGPAAAQSPTSAAYGGSGGILGTVTGGTSSGAATPLTTSPGSSTQTPQGAPASGVLGTQAGGGTKGAQGAPASGVLGTQAGGGTKGAPAGTGNQGVRASASTPASSSSPSTPFAAQSVPSGSLPFTGLDLKFLTAGSLLLVAMGFGLRRLGRPAVPTR